MKPCYFGTDGIRGAAYEPPLTIPDVMRWGAAWAEVARCHGVESLLLGWDPRESSLAMAEAFASGAERRITVRALGMQPTPAIALKVASTPGAWGVVVSASHNPPADNGLKGLDGSGEKLAEDIEEQVEAAYRQVGPPGTLRPLQIEADGADAYLAHVDPVQLPDDFRAIVDCAHGATASFVRRALRGEGIRYRGVPADGARINVGVGAADLAGLQAVVKQTGANIGIAFDGDGDRCMAVASDGSVVDGDQILWLLVRARIAAGDPPAGVVGTVMSNGGLEAALRRAHVPFVRTAVGDKYLGRELRARGWDLAAEASGHVIQRRLGPTGDGIATAVTMLRELLRYRGESRWNWRFEPWPFRTVNVCVAERRPLERCVLLQQVIGSIGGLWGDSVRTVVRWSGTEPKLRLTVEGQDEARVAYALDALEHA
ncbi:MAG: hypothetical protein WCJ30_17325, partial [Deltaproteobacteria bacterium]